MIVHQVVEVVVVSQDGLLVVLLLEHVTHNGCHFLYFIHDGHTCTLLILRTGRHVYDGKYPQQVIQLLLYHLLQFLLPVTVLLVYQLYPVLYGCNHSISQLLPSTLFVNVQICEHSLYYFVYCIIFILFILQLLLQLLILLQCLLCFCIYLLQSVLFLIAYVITLLIKFVIPIIFLMLFFIIMVVFISLDIAVLPLSAFSTIFLSKFQYLLVEV